MQTRRDQLDAHKYLVRRLNSALVDAEPDAPESPPRRDAKTVIGGVLAGVLSIVVVGLYAALFSGGSTAWQQAGTVIVNKSDGSRYLFIDGVLRPVRSMSAARLAVGSAVTITVVSPGALSGTPVGPPVGVAGTPDSLPTSATLADSAWTVCAPTVGAATADAGSTVVGIGPAAAGSAQALLVSDGEHTWLLSGGSRHLLAVGWAADSVGVASARPVPVPPSWLSLVPLGDPVQPPLVSGHGHPGPTINGVRTTIGQLVVAFSSNYLVVENGIAALTPLQAALVRGDPTVPAPLQVPESAISSLARKALPVSAHPLPQQPVRVPTPSGGDAPCLVVRTSASAAPSYSLSMRPPPAGAHPVTPSAAGPSATGSPDGSTAVAVAAGSGALVAAEKPDWQQIALNRQPMPDVWLVTDTGQAYSVGSVDALKALGFGTDDVHILPMSFVNQLERGPALR